MNKIYKVIWNEALKAWVAVSELAKGKTKSASGTVLSEQGEKIVIHDQANYSHLFRQATLVAAMGLFTPAAWAAGTGCMTANDLSAIAIDGTSLTGGVTCTASNNGSVVIVGNGDGQVGSGTKEGISLAVRVDGSTGPIRNVISAVGSSNIASGGSTGTNVLDVRIGDSQAITNGTLRAFAGKISMGDATTLASATSSQAIGASAIVAAAATNGTALGTGATVNSSDGVAIGTSSTVSTNAADSAAIGSGATVGDSAKQSIAFGKGTTVTATNPALDFNQIAIGTNAISSGESSIAIGNSAKAISGTTDSVAIGTGATVGTNSGKVAGATAIGQGSSVASDGGTALGGGTINAFSANGIAIGKGAQVIVSGGTSIAIGNSATAGVGNYNISIGRSSNASGIGASAYGEGTVAVGDGTLALGQKANASLLVGSTWVAGGVALGSNSKVESAASTVSSAKVGNVNLSGFAGTVSGPGGQVSVGSTAAGGQRQIRNVAAGAITATSTDGINGSQLYSAATALTARTDTLGEDTAAALGGGASYDPVAGHLSAPSYTITKTDGTTYPAANNVGQALGNLNAEVIKPLTFTGTTGSTANKLGSTVAIIGDSKNITTAVTANQVKVQISDTPSFTSVTTGSSVLNTNGLTITGGPSVLVGGINAGNKVISNVAPGAVTTTSTEAVNGSQLKATNDNITTLQGGFTLNSNGANGGAVTAGSTVDIGTATGETNLTVTKTGNTIDFALNKNLDVTSVKTGNSLLNTNGLAITGGPSVLATGIDAGSKKITNVADGTIAAGSKDAVNGGQLKTTNDNVTTNTNNITTLQGGFTLNSNGANGGAIQAGDTVDIGTATGETNLTVTKTGDTIDFALNKNLDVTSVKTGSSLLNTNGLAITGGPSVLATGIDAGSKKITNVADGTIAAGSKDAVNGGQLKTVSDNITTLQGGFTLNSNGANGAAIKAGDTVDIGTVTGETNLTVSKTGNTIDFALNKALTVDSVTAGPVVIDKTTGINAGNLKVTNVADGTIAAGSKDAVNGGQLKTTNDNVTTNSNNITALQGGFTLNSNGANGAAIKAGDTVDIGTATGETNLTVTKTGNTIDFALNKNLDVTSVKTGNSLLNTNGLTITGGPSVLATGIDAGSKKITNVADGTLAAGSKDAVNGGQLKTVSDNITTLQGGFTLNSNGANGAAIKAGDTVDIGTVTGETNLTVSKTGNTIDFALNKALTVDSVTAGPVVIDKTTGINAGNLKVTNVADGTIAAGSKDAVNGGQLKTTNDNVTANTNNINNINSNLTTLNGGFILNSNGANGAAIKAGDTVDIGTATGETNLTVSKTGNTIDFALNKNLDVTSVKTGNSLLNTNGLTITGGPSVLSTGIDAGSKKITNVADGTVSAGSKDAVNGSQLAAAISKVGGAAPEVTAGKNISVSTTTGSGGQNIYEVKTADDVSFTKTTVGTVVTDSATGKISGLTAATLSNTSTEAVNGSQLKATNDNVTTNTNNINNINSNLTTLNGGFTLNSNGANGAAIKAGDTVDIGTATGETNLTVTKMGNTIDFALNKNLDVTSVKTGNSLLNTNGLTITGGPSVLATGIDAGSKKITNVADGTIAAGSKDAVNGGQLKTVSDNITTLQGGFTLNSNGANGAAIKAGDTVDIGTVTGETNLTVSKTGNTIDFALNKALTVDSVTAGPVVIDKATGINAGNLKVTNVAPGTVSSSSTDAINGSQLFGVSDSIKNSIGGNTTVNADGTITTNNIGGTGSNTIDGAITELGKSATAAKTEVVQGDNMVVTESKGKDGQSIYNVATAKEVNFDKVTVGSVVTDGTTGKISGLSAGTVSSSSTDAINGSQLYGVSNSISNSIGGNTTVNADGTITTNNIGGTGSNTIDGAITELGKNATAAKTEVVQGDNMVVTESKAADGHSIYNVATPKEVNFDKVTVGSVVTDGTTGKISGLSAGTVSSSSTDAINGSQLYGVSNSISNTIGGNTTVNPDGTITTNNIGGTGSNTIDGAITELGKSATAAKTEVVQGDNMVVTESKAADGHSIYNVATAKEVNFDKVTVGSVVTDGTTGKISGLSAGTVSSSSTDAINGSQLYGVSNSISNSIGGNTTVNPDGTITTNNIGGTGSNTIDGAITELGKSATAAKTEVVQGDNMVVTESKAADGHSIYNVATAKEVNFDKVTVGSVVTDGTTGKISGLSAGTVSSSSTDAINGSQLYGVSNSISNSIGGNTTVNPDGTITTNNIGGTGSNTIDGAITELGKNATAAKTEVVQGDNMVVTESKAADGHSIYNVATAKEVNFDKVTVGSVTIDKATNTVNGLSNITWDAKKFTSGQGATEDQLYAATNFEVSDGNGGSTNINIGNVVINKEYGKGTPNPDSDFITFDKSGQQVTDHQTIGQTVAKMNREGTKFFHTNAKDSSSEVGITNDSSAGGDDSTAIGVNAVVEAGANNSLAMGHKALVTAVATDAIAIGSKSIAGGESAIALGNGAQALGKQSISIGTGNVVKGNNSGAIGDPSIVDGNNAYSVGNNNTISVDDGFAFGNHAVVSAQGGVALGTGAQATVAGGIDGYTLAQVTATDKAAILATKSTTGAVAVGGNGVFRQITGVAAGMADSDAVNVAQLKGVDHQVKETQQTLVDSLGAGSKINVDGTITGPIFTINKQDYTSVGDALTALDQNISNINNGKTGLVQQIGGAPGTGNITVGAATGGTVIDMKGTDGDRKIINVADGTVASNSKEVVNGSQLWGVSNSIKNVIGGNTTVNMDGSITVGNIGGTTSNTIDGAISELNNSIGDINNGKTGLVQQTGGAPGKGEITVGAATGGNVVNMKGTDGDRQVTGVADGKVIQNSKDAVNGGQLWTVQQQVDQNTTDISNIQNNLNSGKVGLVQQDGGAPGSGNITVAKDTGGSKVVMTGTEGDRQVTGVADGAVNKQSHDAVNGSQLWGVSNSISNVLGGGSTVNVDGTISDPNYNVDGKDYHNVGGAIDALNSKDKQLNDKIENLSNHIGDQLQITNNKINDVEKKANAGIAAAMALEAAPYVPGKYTYAAGAAYHGGENAVGVTLRKTADNGRWSITGGVAAASQGDPSFRIGISGVID